MMAAIRVALVLVLPGLGRGTRGTILRNYATDWSRRICSFSTKASASVMPPSMSIALCCFASISFLMCHWANLAMSMLYPSLTRRAYGQSVDHALCRSTMALPTCGSSLNPGMRPMYKSVKPNLLSDES